MIAAVELRIGQVEPFSWRFVSVGVAASLLYDFIFVYEELPKKALLECREWCVLRLWAYSLEATLSKRALAMPRVAK